jgi:hypothetical protein
MIGLQLTGRNLVSLEAPWGIVSYEFAGTVDASQVILDSWDHRTKILAGFNLGLDYLFLILYPATIAFVVLWLVELLALGTIPRKLANIIAGSLVIAGILDALENSALLFMLVNSAKSPYSQIAYASAIGKFFLIGIGLIAVIVLLIDFIVKQLR